MVSCAKSGTVGVMMTRQLIILIVLLTAGVVWAQDIAEPTAKGIIPIPTTNITESGIFVNPLFCQTALCNFFSPLLFPTLVETDDNDGSLQLANDENFALISNIERSDDGDSYIYTLRDDAEWSDGTPITAYDVFFTYVVSISRGTTSIYRSIVADTLDAVIPLDGSRLLVIPKDIDCDLPTYANFPVIPAHVFDEDFANRAADFFSSNNQTVEGIEEWMETDTLQLRTVTNHRFLYEPTATYGHYTFAGQSVQDYVRLAHHDEQQVLVTESSPRGQSGIDDVIAGDIAFYDNPPANQWDDLRLNPNVVTVTRPSNRWYFLAFNFGDPQEPDNYRDKDDEIQEQEPHPVLVNPDVRRAIQLGIDVQELVDVALWGEGEVMAAYTLPSSWAHNPDLEPFGYDPDTAANLLEAAGWRQINRNGARVCIGCGTADDNNRLVLRLLYNDSNNIDRQVALLIARHLSRIGIEIDVTGAGNAFIEASGQRFDLYLDSSDTSFPVQLDKSWFFSPENDVVSSGSNVGSYINPDVTELFNAIRTLDGCNMDERRERYNELERQVQADLPYAWLFTPYEMTVFHNSIQNVETFAHDPFANIHEWSVWKMP